LGKLQTSRGGEWQQLALAGACILGTALVILNELTSALDAKAEATLFRDFRRVVAVKTAALIAHRFSTVRVADCILVLDRGRICEEDSYDKVNTARTERAWTFELQAARHR